MIPVCKPSIDEQTKKELLAVLDSGWWGYGAKVKEFEETFAKKVNAKYCVATNSCTSALDICLKAYNIKRGELITTPMTFVSDAIVGEWNGMDVTFADIQEDDLCIDINAIVGNPTAIIAVDSHGRLADVLRIRKRFPGALVIEDAAHACYTPGAGMDAEIAVWSFQAVKSMPMWDGGAITTNNETIYKKLKTLTWLGVEKTTFDRTQGKGYQWQYDITQAQGIKAYMTDVQAIVGLGQLRRLDEMLKRRQEIQYTYTEAFNGFSWFKEPKFSYTVQYYTPQFINRDGLCEYLADKGIATSVHFQPLSETTYWKKAVKRPLPITDRVWKNLLSLPCYDTLTNEEQQFIIKSVLDFYK